MVGESPFWTKGSQVHILSARPRRRTTPSSHARATLDAPSDQNWITVVCIALAAVGFLVNLLNGNTTGACGLRSSR